MTQIKKKYIGSEQVGSEQLLIEQNQAVKALSSSGLGLVKNLVKFDENDTVLLGDVVALLATDKGVTVATLDASGKVPAEQIPYIAITQTSVVASEMAMLATPAQIGDVVIRTDLNKSFILGAEPGMTLSNWIEILAPISEVLSVNGQVGNVVLSTDDVQEPIAAINKYYTQSRFDQSLLTKSTDDLAEGSANLYFTDSRAQIASVLSTMPGLEEEQAPTNKAYSAALMLGIIGQPTDTVEAYTIFGYVNSKVVNNTAVVSDTTAWSSLAAKIYVDMRTLNDLYNVDAAAANDGDFLSYNAGTWLVESGVSSTPVNDPGYTPPAASATAVSNYFGMELDNIYAYVYFDGTDGYPFSGLPLGTPITAQYDVNGPSYLFNYVDAVGEMNPGLAGFGGYVVKVRLTADNFMALQSASMGYPFSATWKSHPEGLAVPAYKVIKTNSYGQIDDSFFKRDIDLGAHRITNLSNPVEYNNAANKRYVDSQTLTYTVYSHVLTQTDIDNGYLDVYWKPVDYSVSIFVDRLALHQNEDFAISLIGSGMPGMPGMSPEARISFLGEVALGGLEALVAGDKLRIKYATRPELYQLA